MIGFAPERLMALEVQGPTGAAHGSATLTVTADYETTARLIYPISSRYPGGRVLTEP